MPVVKHSISRRRFWRVGAGGLGACWCRITHPAVPAANNPPWRRHASFLDLHRQFPEPIRIQSLQMIQVEGKSYLRARSQSGGVGVCLDNGRMRPLLSLLRERVIPFFEGRDARDLESLVEEVFLTGSNYKYAGLAFWCCVGFVEIALFDLMARTADKPVHALLGKQLRDRIPVYLSRFNRDNSAREEIDAVTPLLRRFGLKATKLKVGRRMYTTPEQMKRDVEMVHLARERWGPEVAILVDANGSWTTREALRFGRETADARLGFIEEPCRWQDYWSTRAVARELETPIAAGEQDTSFEIFTWMAGDGGIRILQPDVYYNGGFIRSLRVARMAQAKGRLFTPHSPKTGFAAAANLHLVSVVPNLGPFQEYREAPEIENGAVPVPPGPGLDGRLDMERFCLAEPI